MTQPERLKDKKDNSEEVLQEREEQLRRLFERSVDPVLLLDKDTFVDCNQAAVEIMHCSSKEEILGRHPWDISPEVQPDGLLSSEKGRELLAVAVKEGSARFEWVHLRTDGEQFWVEVTLTQIPVHGRQIMYTSWRDIGKRKIAEQASKQSEAKYRNIFENAVEGMFQTTTSGHYINTNPALALMFGYESPLEMMSTVTDIAAQQYVDPQERVRFKQILQRDGIVEKFETEFYRKDRKRVWISINARAVRDDTGKILYIEGTIEDITLRKQAEEALQESEAQYRTVVENSIVGFYIIQNGLFRFVNNRFCEMFEYTYDEIVDKLGPVDLAHPDDKGIVAENVNKRITGEMEYIEYDFRGFTKAGAVILVKVIGSSIVYHGDRAATGSIINITRERMLETQLRQAQKMEAIGTLAGGVAHDFNNILTVMAGYGSLIQKETGEKGLLRSYADQIVSAAGKAAQLTRSLLAFSRQQPITLAPLHLNDTIRQTEGLLKRLVTEDIAVRTIFSPDEITVMADATQIDQILFNLASNARDAMPGGGSLTVETKIVHIGRDFVQIHGFGESGRYALLSVSDTGCGMDRVTREHIFDPFFTTKEAGKGTGLGLSTVYGIVKQHSGYINVYSEQGIGTTFHVYLPAVNTVPIEEEPVAPEMRTGSETILIAEDDASVRGFISDLLRMSGYTVIEAKDGEDAVDKFARSEKVDIVILDSVMPKKNGREACEEIKKIRPDIRVLFMSGYTRDMILDEGIRDKEFHFISKPVSPEVLLRTLREILDERAGIQG